jgi:AGZA family xanthine/uracil permease-like MFS transporter
MIEKFFQLQKNGTTARTEVIGGLTTFMTMAYILAVNPNILSASGMDSDAILIATCLAAFVGTMCMALMANYPFALAPGLGLNAYFAYTVCGKMGYSWQIALLAVFVEGVIFIILSLTKVREAIFNAIPMSLKKGVGAGIGLFVAFIGFQNAHVVVNDESTLVTVVDFTKTWHTAGISALLAMIGLMIVVVLEMKNVRAALLLGIFITWIMGIICQAGGVYIPDPKAGFYSVYPSLGFTDFSKLGLTFGQCFNVDFAGVKPLDFAVVTFSFLFVDMFDTIGTLIGVSDRAGMLDENDKLPNVKQALTADAIATCAGAVFGTSTTTTFVESSAGVGAGARTGLASVVTGFMFLVAIFFAPVFTSIPGFAAAPALLYVGFLMVSAVLDLKFDDIRESVPAYLTLISMPLCYSIAEGISTGVISYVIINVIGNIVCEEKKKITPLMYVLAILFVLKYVMPAFL